MARREAVACFRDKAEALGTGALDEVLEKDIQHKRERQIQKGASAWLLSGCEGCDHKAHDKEDDRGGKARELLHVGREPVGTHAFHDGAVGDSIDLQGLSREEILDDGKKDKKRHDDNGHALVCAYLTSECLDPPHGMPFSRKMCVHLHARTS